MTVTFYHQTSAARAREILREGFRDEPTLSEELAMTYTGGDRRMGVWLTDRPLGAEEGRVPAADEVTLRIELSPTMDDFTGLISSSVGHPDEPGSYYQWLVPAAVLNGRAAVSMVEP